MSTPGIGVGVYHIKNDIVVRVVTAAGPAIKGGYYARRSRYIRNKKGQTAQEEAQEISNEKTPQEMCV